MPRPASILAIAARFSPCAKSNTSPQSVSGFGYENVTMKPDFDWTFFHEAPMPTIITHAVPALALGSALGFRRISPRLFWAVVFCAVLPDFDVIGFRLGVNYADLLGHRGFSHSLLFAALCGVLAWAAAPFLRCRRWLAFALIFAAVASHIALDAATSGGLGVAAFWPFSDERYFLPWRPIRVSPLSLRAFMSGRGLAVLQSEFLWVWLPCLTLAAAARLWLSRRR